MDNMQLWLSSSTDSINLNDSAEGFYLNPDLEGLTGLPEIRSVNGLNAGYDGGWTATQLWAARLITIRGVIAINDKAAVETKRKALAKILSQGKNEDLELKFVSEAGNTYTTTVRTSYCTMALQRVFWRQEYQIQLRANDPLIYDDGGSELIAILRVMAGEGGFEIPFDIPFDIGGSITPTSIDVGDEATYPLIRLKGDLHNPTIINMTTNQRMQVLADIITTVEWRDYTTAYTTNGFTQIGDGIDGAPLSLTHLYGNATQKTLSGKNLFNTSSYTIQGAGLTITRESDGSFTLNGTITGNVALVFTNNIPLDGDYTIITIGDALPVDSSYFNLYENADITGSIAYYNLHSTAHYKNFTYTGNSLSQRLLFGPGTYNNTKLRPMLVKGTYNLTNIGDYEPYCGGVPSPNPDYPQDINVVSGEQTVKIMGKNLLDPAPLAPQVFEGTISDHYYYDAKLWYEVEAGKTYTLSLNADAISVVPYTFIVLLGRASSGQPTTEVKTVNNISTVGGRVSMTFTITQDKIDTAGGRTLFMRIPRYGSPTTSSYKLSNIMLEESEESTSYEPYQAQSYTIDLDTLELAKIGTYQDYIWNDGGTWKIHKEVGKAIWDGSESWTTASNYCYHTETAAYVPESREVVADILCDNFTPTTYLLATGITLDYAIALDSNNAGRFALRHKDYQTASTLKTWLSTHNTTVYYALATPTDTEITDSELIEQLNHIYSLYGGVNNIMLIPSGGAQGEMEVSYATTEDIDYHEVVIDCQARTVTQDGHNLYPALADGSEFIRLVPGENKLYLTSEVESDNGTAEVKFKKGNISI